MKLNPNRLKLFIPGPTHVPDDVMSSITVPQIGHRTPEFSDLMESIVSRVKRLLYTKNRIFLTSNPATGLWEMGIVNSVTKGVLHAANGSFSSKWSDVSKRCGYDLGVINYDWGKGIKADDVDKELSTGKYDVFAMVHNETSTGVMSDLESISKLMKEKYPEIIWLVDAVSSMAGVKIDVDRLGIDFLLSSTQKAWGLPAGFSLCSVSDRVFEKSLTIKNKGYFFDFSIYDKYYQKMQTPSTPSIPHMYGMKFILDQIDAEGLESRWKRHMEMASYTQNWAYDNGQRLFPEQGCESYTITCIDNIQGWDIEYINNELINRGFRMDRGYGKLRYKTFRVAHMGNIFMDDLKEYLESFKKCIK